MSAYFRCLVLPCALLLAACGGGGGGSSSSATASSGQRNAGCSLRERQDWAAGQLREWYLFPETLPAALDPAPYASVDDYVDALTATARGQGRDRYFTYVTSVATENAYYNSGASAGFGIRLATDAAQRRVTVTEAFEGAPALAAGIDRGAEIVAIGNTPATLRAVGDIIAAEGAAGVTAAIGPSTAGLARTLRVRDSAGTRDVTVAKADYALDPVSPRYGVRVIDDGGRKVGYLNLRTFIDTATPELRAAFAQFRAAGVTDVIVDLRYNGGGLTSIAGMLGNLLGGERGSRDVFAYTVFRPEKASSNETAYFVQQPQTIAPMRIAFIGTAGTASASELTINAFVPYLHDRAALIGTNTYGKPVGQIALDRTACDDRLRVIAFATQNAARAGGYFTGLAGSVEASCQADDDLAHPLGDPQEASTAQALAFLAGRACTPIAAGGQSGQSLRSRLELLTPAHPDTAQREVPGLF